jgi:uncharacterized protein YjbJ (UPF0337 family)
MIAGIPKPGAKAEGRVTRRLLDANSVVEAAYEFRPIDLWRDDLHSGTGIREPSVGTSDALHGDTSPDHAEPKVDVHSQKARNSMGEIIDKTKGKIKQVAGAVAGNDKLKADGELDEFKGNVKGAVGKLKRAVKGAAK